MNDQDGYDGAARLVAGDDVIEVSVTLRGHFDPIVGKYSWYGRVASSAAVGALIDAGARRVTLSTPHSDVATSLSDVDPWGRPRVEGFGPPPFEVLDSLPDDAR